MQKTQVICYFCIVILFYRISLCFAIAACSSRRLDTWRSRTLERASPPSRNSTRLSSIFLSWACGRLKRFSPTWPNARILRQIQGMCCARHHPHGKHARQQDRRVIAGKQPPRSKRNRGECKIAAHGRDGIEQSHILHLLARLQLVSQLIHHLPVSRRHITHPFLLFFSL